MGFVLKVIMSPLEDPALLILCLISIALLLDVIIAFFRKKVYRLLILAFYGAIEKEKEPKKYLKWISINFFVGLMIGIYCVYSIFS